jgi:hypothetical protein
MRSAHPDHYFCAPRFAVGVTAAVIDSTTCSAASPRLEPVSALLCGGDRQRKGKGDYLDAINAAKAAKQGHRPSVPKSKDGKVESLRVLRVAHNAVNHAGSCCVCRLFQLRDQVRKPTRMQFVHTCAAWRPDTTDATDPATATDSAEIAHPVHPRPRGRNHLCSTSSSSRSSQTANPTCSV